MLGVQKADVALSCSADDISISPHLLQGIREIWTQAKERFHVQKRVCRLWIDAICIHQADDVEKAGQIPLMTMIYSNAQRVIVWLGTATDGSNLALDNLKSLGNTLAGFTRTVGAHEFDALGLPPLDDLIWSGITEILSRPWFRRLWVVQEVVLAKDIVLMAGNRSVGFKMFATSRC